MTDIGSYSESIPNELADKRELIICPSLAFFFFFFFYFYFFTKVLGLHEESFNLNERAMLSGHRPAQ